jgi:hypothetical protein
LPSQLEFDRRDIPRVVAALVAAAKQAIFALVPAALGLLALILTVAEAQTVGAAIVPGCFGNRGLSCRGTKSSNPSPSSAESATNLVAAGGVARGWDSEFESALLQQPVCLSSEP